MAKAKKQQADRAVEEQGAVAGELVKAASGDLIPVPSGPEDQRGLSIYDKFRDIEEGIKFLSDIIYNSRMFGDVTRAQSQMLAFACFCEKIHPFALKKRYHIIRNNLAMRSDAMQAGFMAAGGKLTVHEATSECVDVEGEFQGMKARVRMTHDDAKKEPFYWDRSGKKPKDNWATPYMRGCMLWARVISTLVRRLTPFVVAGVYTPEEVIDFAPVEEPIEASPIAGDSLSAPRELEGEVEEPTGVEEPEPEPERVGAKEASGSEAVEEAPPEKKPNNEEFRITEEQAKRIEELAKQLKISPQKMQAGLLKNFGVQTVGALDVEQADALIEKFEQALAKKA